MSSHVHICVLSTELDDLPRRKQASLFAVARVLAKTGRFSNFEATANPVIARTMDKVIESGWFDLDREVQGFPWTVVKLTDKGRKALARGQ